MLLTEHAIATTRQRALTSRRTAKLPSLAAAIAWVRQAGSLRAWLCFGVVGYVFVVAALNLFRFGIVR
jgi:hypothetical protein